MPNCSRPQRRPSARPTRTRSSSWPRFAPTADRGHLAVDEVYFLQRLYAAGAQPYFDVAAIQPFGFGHAPQDARGQRDILNFQRARWVRRAMVAAGDAQTPLLAVRYGWNRQPNSTWGAVISPSQARFAGEALDIAYARWPWIGGMGWAAYRPDAPASDPIWGFSLNDATARALAEWRQTQPVRAAALAAHPPPQRDWPRWLLLLAVTGLASWRLVAAARLLPWQRWQRLPEPAARLARRHLAGPGRELLLRRLASAHHPALDGGCTAGPS